MEQGGAEQKQGSGRSGEGRATGKRGALACTGLGQEAFGFDRFSWKKVGERDSTFSLDIFPALDILMS